MIRLLFVADLSNHEVQPRSSTLPAIRAPSLAPLDPNEGAATIDDPTSDFITSLIEVCASAPHSLFLRSCASLWACTGASDSVAVGTAPGFTRKAAPFSRHSESSSIFRLQRLFHCGRDPSRRRLAASEFIVQPAGRHPGPDKWTDERPLGEQGCYVHLSVCLSVFCLSVHLSVCLSVSAPVCLD